MVVPVPIPESSMSGNVHTIQQLGSSPRGPSQASGIRQASRSTLEGQNAEECGAEGRGSKRSETEERAL